MQSKTDSPAQKEQSVLIVGGGISGLATAIALAKVDLSVTVLERRKADENDGAGIQIGPNGVKVLKHLGVHDELQKQISTPDHISVRVGQTNKQLSKLPLGSWIAQRHGESYWTASRQALFQALLHFAQKDRRIKIYYDCQIQSVSESEKGATALSQDGAQFEGIAAIHADGIFSKRDPKNALRATGKTAFRAVTASNIVSEPGATQATTLWLHPGAHVVRYPVNHGQDLAYVVIVAGEFPDLSWNRAATINDLRQHKPLFHTDLWTQLNKIEGWKSWTLYEKQAHSTWSTKRTTCIGDAAAPVLPFLAQGGVLALEDAVVLAHCIEKHNSEFAIAFSDFEQQRRQRRERVAKASKRMGEVYHLSGAMAAARNTTLALLPGALTMRQYDWLYGWNLPHVT